MDSEKNMKNPVTLIKHHLSGSFMLYLRKLILFILIVTVISFYSLNYFYLNKVIKIGNDIRHSKFTYPNYTKDVLEKIRTAKQCFKLENPPENVQLIVDLEKSPPKTNRSIFFVLTTCLKTSRVAMSARCFFQYHSEEYRSMKLTLFPIFSFFHR